MFDDFFKQETVPSLEYLSAAENTLAPCKMQVVQLKPPMISHSPVIVPNVETTADGKTVSHMYVFGTIGGSRDYVVDMTSYHYAYNALLSATSNDIFKIYIDTPGGDVTLMAHLISAIGRTAAHVITIAAGAVMSAGGPLWAAGHEREILDHAIFMFHFSSHGDGGHTVQIAETADALKSYIDFVMLPLLEIGVITQADIETAAKRTNVYISAYEARRRIASRTAGV